jgi:ribonuclease-3
LQHAHNVNSQNLLIPLAQPAELTTAARFSRSDLFSSLTAQLGISLRPELLELAFTHRSFAYESGAKETNERLEFLGDSVLGLIVTEELYLRYPDLDESRLSPLRSGIVNMRALADIARTLELGKYIRLGKGEEVTGGRDKNSLLADALEALIGAIYLECGFDTTTKVVRELIRETMESAMAKGAGLDGKTALQELVSSLGKGALEYLVSGQAIAQGTGKSKREAEQSAARSAYEILATLK